jgi:thymidine kinase
MYLGVSFGPMFAGKTTYLCDKDRMYSKKPEWKVIAVDPKINMRD